MYEDARYSSATRCEVGKPDRWLTFHRAVFSLFFPGALPDCFLLLYPKDLANPPLSLCFCFRVLALGQLKQQCVLSAWKAVPPEIAPGTGCAMMSARDKAVVILPAGVCYFP